MNEPIKWFLINVIGILFILFLLDAFLGIEFNEYPHTNIKIIGDNNQTVWNEYIFCPKWIHDPNKYKFYNKLIEIDFFWYYKDFNITSCPSYSTKWIDPEMNRVTYYSHYEISLTSLYEYNKEIEIEFIEKRRSFLLIRGKSLIPF